MQYYQSASTLYQPGIASKDGSMERLLDLLSRYPPHQPGVPVASQGAFEQSFAGYSTQFPPSFAIAPWLGLDTQEFISPPAPNEYPFASQFHLIDQTIEACAAAQDELLASDGTYGNVYFSGDTGTQAYQGYAQHHQYVWPANIHGLEYGAYAQVPPAWPGVGSMLSAQNMVINNNFGVPFVNPGYDYYTHSGTALRQYGNLQVPQAAGDPFTDYGYASQGHYNGVVSQYEYGGQQGEQYDNNGGGEAVNNMSIPEAPIDNLLAFLNGPSKNTDGTRKVGKKSDLLRRRGEPATFEVYVDVEDQVSYTTFRARNLSLNPSVVLGPFSGLPIDHIYAALAVENERLVNGPAIDFAALKAEFERRDNGPTIDYAALEADNERLVNGPTIDYPVAEIEYPSQQVGGFAYDNVGYRNLSAVPTIQATEEEIDMLFAHFVDDMAENLPPYSQDSDTTFVNREPMAGRGYAHIDPGLSIEISSALRRVELDRSPGSPVARNRSSGVQGDTIRERRRLARANANDRVSRLRSAAPLVVSTGPGSAPTQGLSAEIVPTAVVHDEAEPGVEN